MSSASTPYPASYRALSNEYMMIPSNKDILSRIIAEFGFDTAGK
jgi:hypothetical protein